jgi:hypothetical protein
MSKMDWRGIDDSTPDAMPTTPDKEGDGMSIRPDGDWHGMPDSTPASMPTTPDKEP